MALATRCPHCNTTFRVAADQLKLRGGIVRCGSCHEIFDGNKSLFDPDAVVALPPAVEELPPASTVEAAPSALAEPEPAPEPEPVPAPEPAPEAEPEAEAAPLRKVDLRYEPDPGFDIEPPPPPFNGYVDFPLDLIEEDIVAIAAPAPAPAPVDGLAPADAVSAGLVPAEALPAAAVQHDAAPQQPAAEEAALEEAAPDDAAHDAAAQDDATHDDLAADPAHDDLAAAQAPVAVEGYYDDPPDYYDDAPELTTPVALPVEERHSVLPNLDSGPLPLLRQASESPVTATAAPLPLPVAAKPKKKKPKPRPQPQALEAAPAEPEHDEPAFVRRGRELEQAGRTRRIALAAGSAILALALLAQGVTTFRNVLAASVPALKGPLSAACTLFDCKVELPAEIDALSIETGELQTLGGNHFSLSTALRNQSGLIQAWPTIELALTDPNDNILLRRIIAPVDYLPRDIPAGKGFPARGEQPVKLQFEVSQVKASGYRIAIFYP